MECVSSYENSNYICLESPMRWFFYFIVEWERNKEEVDMVKILVSTLPQNWSLKTLPIGGWWGRSITQERFEKKKVKCDDYGGHIKQTKRLNEMFVWNVVGMRMDVVPDHEKPWKPFMGKDLIIWAIKFCLAYLNIHALLSTLDFDSKTTIIEMNRDYEMRK